MGGTISDDLRLILESSEVKNFLTSAQNFIDILENNELSSEEFYKKTHPTLLSLYTAGLSLPEIDLNYSDEKTIFDEAKLFQNQKQVDISSKLGKDSIYYEVFDPIHPTNDEPTQGWLVDDYSDIYRDLKIELEKIKVGTNEAVEDALWQLKFSLEHHWGNHCINALRALHYLKYYNYGF